MANIETHTAWADHPCAVASTRDPTSAKSAVEDIEDCVHVSRTSRAEGNVTGRPLMFLPVGGTIRVAIPGPKPATMTSNVFVMGARLILARDFPWVVPGAPASDVAHVELDVPHQGWRQLQYRRTDLRVSARSGTAFLPAPDRLGPDHRIPVVAPASGLHVCVVPYRGQSRALSLGQVTGPVAAAISVGGRVVHLSAYGYTCDTVAGDCGAPVVSAAGVVGTHIAYDAERGVNLFVPFVVHAEARLVTSEHLVQAQSRRDDSPTRRFHALSLEPTAGLAFAQARLGSGVSAVPRGRAQPAGRAPATPRPAPRARSRVGFRPPSAKPEARVERPRPEAGIVGMGPAPSDNYDMSTASATSGVVDRYIEQLINPWTAPLQRLPDDNIRATAVARFIANRTYTLANTSDNGNNLLVGCHNKMSRYAVATPPTEASSTVGVVVSSAPATTAVQPYQYSPGNILVPLQFNDEGIDETGIVPLVGSPVGPWGDDFGPEQELTSSWSSAMRTLAMAIRLRVIGLPSGQFMAPGKVYAAQVRWNANDLPTTEQDFVNLERLGSASHVSLDAVRAAGSKTWYALPDGTDKFELSSSFAPSPGVFKSSEVTVLSSLSPAAGSAVRLFPQTSGLQGSADGGAASRAIVPFYTVASTGVVPVSGPVTGLQDASDQQVADQTQMLLLGFFGLADGVVLEVDYARVDEVLPSSNAPPSVDTAIQLRSAAAMDGIFNAAALLSMQRTRMYQTPGDLTITAPAPGQNASPEARRMLASVRNSVRKSSGAAIKRREGWFDWLSQARFGRPGQGFQWDFTDHPMVTGGERPRRGQRN